MTVTLVLREPTPDAEAFVSRERIGSAFAPHGTFVQRPHPADRNGPSLYLSPGRRPTRGALRVKHVRIDADLAALGLPHPSQAVGTGRCRRSPKVRSSPTIFSLRRHFADTASTSSAARVDITGRAVQASQCLDGFRFHGTTLGPANHRVTIVTSIFPPTQAITSTRAGTWFPPRTAPSDSHATSHIAADRAAPAMGYFPQFCSVGIPKARHVGPKATLRKPSVVALGRWILLEQRLLWWAAPPAQRLPLRTITGISHPLVRWYRPFHLSWASGGCMHHRLHAGQPGMEI
jgi:hypothetical protein